MITDIASKMMAMMNAAKQRQGCDYSEVESRLSELRAAVEQAMQRDDNEASGFWFELGRIAKHGFNYAAERARFYAQADALKSSTTAELVKVEHLCRSILGIHASAPAELLAAQQEWKGRANEVRAMQARARALQNGLSGWQGPSRENYETAAGVQVAALEELQGVMLSTGESCAAGALLNEALFFHFKEALSGAIRRIRSAPGAAGDQYYLRTATAKAECLALVSQLPKYRNGGPAAGSVSTLAKQCVTTITMPNLLQAGQWPTGTQGAGVDPADTSGGVPPDHTADVDAPSGGGACVPGVNG